MFFLSQKWCFSYRPPFYSTLHNLQHTSKKLVHVLQLSSNGPSMFCTKRPSSSPCIASCVHVLQWLSKTVSKISRPGFSGPVFTHQCPKIQKIVQGLHNFDLNRPGFLPKSSNRPTSSFRNIPFFHP